MKLAPAHRARLLLMSLVALALAAFFVMLSSDWLLGDDSLGVVEGSLGWHSAPPAADLPIDTFLPGQKRDLSAGQALAQNLSRAITRHNPAPPVFHASWLAPSELGRASECMASAIYYEAAGESDAGQIAVAQVILNRLRHPRYPKSICEVVYQGAERPGGGCQFTFACDGSLALRPDAAGMARARRIADLALHGLVSPIAGQATHYHSIWIVPLWAQQMREVAIIGHHVFYRPPADYGDYPALAEPTPGGIGASPMPWGAPQPNAPLFAPEPAPGHPSPEPNPPIEKPNGANRNGGTAAPSAAGAPTPAPQPAEGHRNGYFAQPRRNAGALALPSAP